MLLLHVLVASCDEHMAEYRVLWRWSGILDEPLFCLLVQLSHAAPGQFAALLTLHLLIHVPRYFRYLCGQIEEQSTSSEDTENPTICI